MPIVVIPEKVCKKCGGTRWYVRNNGLKNCTHCRDVNSDIWRKKHRNRVNECENIRQKKYRDSLSDSYIKANIQSRSKGTIKYKDISQREIDITRKMIEIRRHFNPTKMKNYTSEQIQQFKNEYEELGILVKEVPKEERQGIYLRRSHLKKKFSTIEDYENLIALGPERESTPVQEDSISLPSSTINELTLKKENLLQGVAVLMKEINEFNDYVDSFKININTL